MDKKQRALSDVINEMKTKGAHTIGEAKKKCPELLKEYTAIVKHHAKEQK